MRCFGDGPTLWRVSVILRAEGGRRGHMDRLLERLRDLLSERPGEAEPWDLRGRLGTGETGDATIGACFWVRAEDVGAAARIALATTGTRHGLYEVDLMPYDAWVSMRSGVQTVVLRRDET